jgi:hypothetical protein
MKRRASELNSPRFRGHLIGLPAVSYRWARSLLIQNSRRARGSRLHSASVWLLAAVVAIAACGSGSSPNQPNGSSPPLASSPRGLNASPSAAAAKSVQLPDSVVFAGWIGGLPAVAIRDAAETPSKWAIRTLGSAGWLPFGALPDGSMPVADGTTVTNVPDPETGPDLSMAQASGAITRVSLPEAAWVQPWRGIQGVIPLAGRSGYLLVGAGAIAILGDHGVVSVTPTPNGLVGLAPTSDPQRFLLATAKDAHEPGALSESAPFAAYLWTIGSKDQPSIVRQRVVAVAASTIGLAWLRTDDGSWWSLTPGGATDRTSEATGERSIISPDGRQLVRFSDSISGCPVTASDRCPVSLVDDAGSTHIFDGPSSGVGFGGHNIGMVLFSRPALDLPWRLVFGPSADPSTTKIE